MNSNIVNKMSERATKNELEKLHHYSVDLKYR